MSARTFDLTRPKKYGNVEVIHDGLKISVKLHNTIVASFNPHDKAIVLNTGGWKTPTTKTAINNALNQFEFLLGQKFEGVSQKKGVWYLGEGEYSDNMKVKVSPLHIELN
jgi:hypothetical protein